MGGYIGCLDEWPSTKALTRGSISTVSTCARLPSPERLKLSPVVGLDPPEPPGILPEQQSASRAAQAESCATRRIDVIGVDIHQLRQSTKPSPTAAEKKSGPRGLRFRRDSAVVGVRALHVTRQNGGLGFPMEGGAWSESLRRNVSGSAVWHPGVMAICPSVLGKPVQSVWRRR